MNWHTLTSSFRSAGENFIALLTPPQNRERRTLIFPTTNQKRKREASDLENSSYFRDFFLKPAKEFYQTFSPMKKRKKVTPQKHESPKKQVSQQTNQQKSSFSEEISTPKLDFTPKSQESAEDLITSVDKSPLSPSSSYLRKSPLSDSYSTWKKQISLFRQNTFKKHLSPSPKKELFFLSKSNDTLSVSDLDVSRSSAIIDLTEFEEEEEKLKKLSIRPSRKDKLNNIQNSRYELKKRAREYLKKLREQILKFQAQEEFAPFSDDEERKIYEILNDSESEEVISEAFRLKITKKDISCLRDYEWLNDEVINFYMNILIRRCELFPDRFPKVYAFNTHFFDLLQRGYARVRRWTSKNKIDLFSFDKIFIPVHKPQHWCLAVINIKEKKFEYYDSLGGEGYSCLKLLRDYVIQEHKDKKKCEIDLSDWQNYIPSNIPKQENGYDCGVFLCKYADYASQNREFTFKQKNMCYFRKRMILDIIRGGEERE